MSYEEIAIVGIGCRYPGADNIDEFWKVISNGENHVKEIPPDRWNVDAFYDPDPAASGKTYVRRAGLVNRFDEWDNKLFDITDEEAKLIDPRQRMVLECVHMALEDGHITRKDIDGTQTGVYIGSMNDDYRAHITPDTENLSTKSVTGLHTSIISARVSYVYNLFGPAITLDTACSSSLVAIHIGSQALQQGDCDAAICGGVNSIMDPEIFIALSKARMLSPTGQCQTFSADADGYARGEGCGILILKRLVDAKRDGNTILATIKTGSNQDGHSVSPITKPSMTQQIDLLKKLYSKYNVPRSSIDVIEAHGTGTPVGDPIEANALGKFFNENNKSTKSICIGSVKSNIGHTEAAAGIAGVIKVLLMMKYETVVPSLMYTKTKGNPMIDFDSYNFVVPTTSRKWIPSDLSPRIACVNCFGFGGTNAHAILEQYELTPTVTTTQDQSYMPAIITLSACDDTTLKKNALELKEGLQKSNYDLHSLSFTSTVKRDHFLYRKALLPADHNELIEMCEDIIQLPSPMKQKKKSKIKLVFVFCGVGTAWKGMCSEMMSISTFQVAIKHIDTLLSPLVDWSVENRLRESYDAKNDPFCSHILIFASQVGLSAVWKEWGVQPDAVIGQSVGEVAAAYVAETIDLKTAVSIIYIRSECLAEMQTGSMLFINNVPVEDIKQYCASQKGSVEIAVYNSKVSATLSGDSNAIKDLQAEVLLSNSNEAVQLVQLPVQCAYHSSFVDKAASNIISRLHEIKGKQATTPIISTVTGKQESGEAYGTGKYWGENVRQPVCFNDAIQNSRSGSDTTLFVEIGPSPVLRIHAQNIFENEHHCIVLPSMTKGKEIQNMAKTLGVLYEQGLNPNWLTIIPHHTTSLELPKHAFGQHKSLYLNPKTLLKQQGIKSKENTHMYLQRLANVKDNVVFKATVDMNRTPFVFQHVVQGSVLLPGAFHVEIGTEIAYAAFNCPPCETSISLEFVTPLLIENNSKTHIKIKTNKISERRIVFYSSNGRSIVCKGFVQLLNDTFEENVSLINVDQLRQSVCQSTFRKLAHNEIYLKFNSFGFEYGDNFRMLQSCIVNKEACLAEVVLPKDVRTEIEGTTLHPCVLDAMMQSSMNMSHMQPQEINDMIRDEKLTFLPAAIEHIHVFKKPVSKMLIYTRQIRATVLPTVIKIHYSSILFDTKGERIAEIRNFTSYSRRSSCNTPGELKYRLTWTIKSPATRNDCREILVMASAKTVQTVWQDCNGPFNCYPKDDTVSSDTFISETMESAKPRLSEIQAIVVVFDVFTNEKDDINYENALQIFNLTKGNCMFLVKVLKYFSENNVTIPFFIVTQNTQSIENSKAPVNVLGSEIWGFVRAIQMEFVHRNMTLVDVQPSLQEALPTFQNLLSGENEDTEVVIHHNEMFVSLFSKASECELTPEYRFCKNIPSPNVNQAAVLDLKLKNPQSIRSTVSTCVKNPHVILQDRTSITQLRPTSNVHVDVIPHQAFLHPASLFAPTISSLEGIADIWDDSNEQGHEVLGLEYTGIRIPKLKGNIFRCNRSRILPENIEIPDNCKCVVVFPSKLNTVMSVPKSCIVPMKDVPDYQPGFLSTSILFLAMIDLVPQGSKVAILHTETKTLDLKMLERMLMSLKKADIISLSNVSDTDAIDVALSLKMKESAIDIICASKTVICLNGALSQSTRKCLINKHAVIIKELDSSVVYRPASISNLLPKVLAWQRKAKTTTTAEQHDEQYVEHESLIDISKVGTNRMPMKCHYFTVFNKSSTYVITGGLTGLGWELLVYMAEMGAGTLATLSRRSVTEDMMKKIEKVQTKFNCKIVCLQADVCDRKSLEEAFISLRYMVDIGPVTGIFHGAGILDNTLMIKMTEEQLDHVLKPKILGTLNLHIVTRQLNLDHFVLQSSIASLLSTPGQSNYGAANSFLDTFARWRHDRGHNAQSINWGALDVGMAAREEFNDFEKRGYNRMNVQELRSCFMHCIMQNQTGSAYTNLDWNTIAKDFLNPIMSRVKRKIEHLLPEQTIEEAADEDDTNFIFIIENVRNKGEEKQKVVLLKFVQIIAQKILGTEISSESMSLTLQHLGLDSMSAITFINIAYDRSRVRIQPELMLSKDTCLNDVVTYLYRELFCNQAEDK